MGINIFSYGKIFSHTDKYFLLQINGEKKFFGSRYVVVEEQKVVGFLFPYFIIFFFFRCEKMQKNIINLPTKTFFHVKTSNLSIFDYLNKF